MDEPVPAPCASLAAVYRDDPRLSGLIGPGGPFEVEETEIAGIPLRVFVRAPRTIVDCFEMGRAHADARPHRARQERWTFADVHDRARRRPASCGTTFGVRPGDRVAIAMRNLPEFVMSFWAAALNGAIVVPLNAWWTGPELRYALDNAGAKVVFVDPSASNGCSPTVTLRMCTVVSVRGEGGDARVRRISSSGTPLADDEIARLAPDDPVTILYTSGTTGRPKGALGTNRGAIANLWNMAFVNAREAIIAGPTTAAVATDRPRWPPRRCSTSAASPRSSAARWGARRWCSCASGTSRRRCDSPRPRASPPSVAYRPWRASLFEHPKIGELGIDMRGVPLGGAAVAPDLPLKALEVFGAGAQIFNGYGLTETTSAVVTNVGAEFVARPDSVGRPNLTADVKIVDPDDREVDEGDVGEICMRSPQVVTGYWNDEAGDRGSRSSTVGSTPATWATSTPTATSTSSTG